MFCACRDCTSSSEPLRKPALLPLVEVLYNANLGFPDSSAEEKALAFDLLAWQAYLVHINAEITCSPPDVEDWISRQTDAFIHLDKHAAIRHPIRRLPTDVLTEIFLWVLQPDPRTEPADSVNMRAAPWTFTHVSSFWRQSALSFPRLWSDVSMQLRGKQFQLAKSCNAFNALLRLQLQRSESHLLRVHLLWSQLFPSFNGEGLSILMNESHRWSELHLWQPGHALPCLVPLEGKLPELQVLYLHGHASGSYITPMTLFRSLPSLRVVGGHNECLQLQLPWCQVTSLSSNGQGVSNDKFYAILSQLQSLVVAKLVTTWSTRLSDNTSAPTVFVLPSLSSLSLETTGVRSTSQFFSLFTAPQLRSLEIVDGNDTEALISFQTRSGFALESLTIHSDGMSESEFVRLLEVLPTLGSLSLTTTLSNNFIRVLADHAQDLVPQLASFRIEGELTSPHDLCASCEALEEARPQLQISVVES